MNKRCLDETNEFNCKNLLGDYAFESVTCSKKNMVATNLFNCGYSILDRRWISCKSIEEARCGSFQCAANRNQTETMQTNLAKRLGSSFDLIQTGTSVNRTHECVLVIIKQSNLQNRQLNETIIRHPFYAQDGTSCSANNESLENLNIKFCSNGKCVSSTQIDDLLNCNKKANCTSKEKCTNSNRCRCDLSSSQANEFNFPSAYYCPTKRSLQNYNVKNQNKPGVFDKLNFYHLLIIPCLAVVLVLASFLRAYLRTGVYKLKDSSDELSVSFSGPRPKPFWKPQ